jgi:GR25 family glycosyltransferase involved in LPS biosynthesis
MKIYLLTFLVLLLYFLTLKKNRIENFSGQKTKIFVINLDRDWKRMKELDMEMKENNLEYERFSAIKGSELTDESPIIKKYFASNLKKYNNNQKGCTLSHISIWNKIKESNHELTIVMEDDVIIPKNLFQKLDIYLKQLPEDWDILFLGGNRIIGHKYSEHLVSPDISKRGNYGTFAYLIRNKNIDNILGICKNIKLHTDLFMQHELGKDNKIFFCNPQLVKHNYGYFSNNFNRDRKKDEHRNNIITIL